MTNKRAPSGTALGGAPASLRFLRRWPRGHRANSADGGSRGDEGQVVLVVAFLLVPMLALVALALDGGFAYLQRAKAQNAVDAAALAGARRMAMGGTDAQILSAITEYAVTRNGTTSVSAAYVPGGQAVGGGSVPSGGTGVNVTASIPFNTFLAGLVGHPTMTASATAGAEAGVVGSFGPGPSLQPLARRCTQPTIWDCFNEGDLYDIYNYGGPGNFGWLSWSGSSNSGYTETILTPGNTINDYDDPHDVCPNIAVGCWVHGNSGVSNSSGIRGQLNAWVDLGNDGTVTGTSWVTGTPMVIVVFDTSEGSGSNVNYHIVGFAAFVLDSYSLSGKVVWGRFVQWVIPGQLCQTCNMGGGSVQTLHLTN